MSQQWLGVIIQQYQIVELIGEGGVANVYKAVHQQTGEAIAIKIINEVWLQNMDALRRFQGEIEALKRFQHSHIVKLHFSGQQDSVPYFAMSLAGLGSLSQYLKNHRIPMHLLLRLMRQIAGALEVLHENGVIHRDLKPSNILLQSASHAVLSDLGVVRQMEMTQYTQAGQMQPGTLYYMAPEQLDPVKMNAEVGPASDQYSFAVMLYWMLTGYLPFNGVEYVLIQQHLYETAPPLSFYRPELAPLDAVMAKALEKHPSQRYPSIHDFLAYFTVVVEQANLGNLELGYGTVQNPPTGSRPVTSSRPATASQQASSPIPYISTSNPPANPPKVERGTPYLIAAVLVTVAVVVAIMLFAFNKNSPQVVADQPSESPAPTSTRAIASEVPSEETIEPSITATLSARQATQTLEAAINIVYTENAIAETATADSWTESPTPDLRATAALFVTQTAEQAYLYQTATADSWTSTPSPTYTPTETRTPSPTHTPTRTPSPTATASPTRTPSPTATATDTPIATATPSMTDYIDEMGLAFENGNFRVIASIHSWSYDGRYLAIAGDGVYAMPEFERLFRLSEDFSYPIFSADAQYLAVSGEGIYEMPTGEKIFNLIGNYNYVSFSHNNQYFTLNTDGLYELQTGERLFSIGDDGYYEFFSPQSNYLVVGNDGVYYVPTGDKLFRLSEYDYPMFSLDEQYVGVSGDGIYFLDGDSAEKMITIYENDIYPHFSDNSQYVVVAGDGIYYLSGDDEDRIISLADNYNWINFSPDSRYIGITAMGVYELDGNDIDRIFSINGYYGVSFSPDSRYVAVGETGVYELGAEGESFLFEIGGANYFPTFSPDSRYLFVPTDGVYQISRERSLLDVPLVYSYFSMDSDYVTTVDEFWNDDYSEYRINYQTYRLDDMQRFPFAIDITEDLPIFRWSYSVSFVIDYSENNSFARVRGSSSSPTINLRARPSTNADVLDTIEAEAYLIIINSSDGWFEVVTQDGLTGWVSDDLVEAYNP